MVKRTKAEQRKEGRRIQRRQRRKKAVSSVTPPPGRGQARENAAAPTGGIFKDPMNDTITKVWNSCRQWLQVFRASTPKSNTQEQDAAALQQLAVQLEAAAREIDTNRRTSPYNLPSLYQDQTDALISKTMYLARKWVTDGKPQVPII